MTNILASRRGFENIWAGRHSLFLNLLFFSFCLRVVGQALVAFFHVPFLPPMHEWMSGLIQYPPLLGGQLIVIFLLGRICFKVAAHPRMPDKKRPVLARRLTFGGRLYVLVNIVRYVLLMTFFPNERWLGGCIPIAFHFVLAAFILTYAEYLQLSLHQENK